MRFGPVGRRGALLGERRLVLSDLGLVVGDELRLVVRERGVRARGEELGDDGLVARERGRDDLEVRVGRDGGPAAGRAAARSPLPFHGTLHIAEELGRPAVGTALVSFFLFPYGQFV